MGLIQPLDAGALARYCDVWSRWRRAREHIDRHGVGYTKRALSTGETTHHVRPEVGLAFTLAGELATLESSLGLTPRSRAGLPTRPSAAPSRPKARFFDGRG